MSDDVKGSFEKKLDRDFLHYLNLTKSVYEKLQCDQVKKICQAWLTYLFGTTAPSVPEKCNRNIYLSRLLIQMQNAKLSGVFLEYPPLGPLPCAFAAFGLPTEIEGLKGFDDLGFQIDSTIGSGSGDFFESSRDGRTYLATRHLRDGVMAFLAVTNNEGEPIWMPQTSPNIKCQRPESTADTSTRKSGGYTKKLLDYIDAPLSQLRKTPEEREVVYEWMDKMITDCNKWIQGEDPHNMELEQLFTMLYEEYQCDPENAEILKHPRTVRTILYKDIRDKIAERREEVAKRELILDQYEADQYAMDFDGDENIDEVWLECAKRPMSASTKIMLENVYPQEVLDRFNEFLFQERLIIIRRGEKQVQKKIAELRKASVEDTKAELQRLKKAQNDYKQYYDAYNEIEEKLKEYEEFFSRGGKPEEIEEPNIDKVKQDMEFEVQNAKRAFDKEMRVQRELEEKLEVAKDALRKARDCAAEDEEKLNCQADKLFVQMNDLKEQILVLREKNNELRARLNEECQ